MLVTLRAAWAIALSLAFPAARPETPIETLAQAPARNPGQDAAPTPASPPTSPAAFEDLARRADVSREAGRLEEAAGLYREALRLRPRWSQGLWFLGTIAYERDRFPECRDAFRRFLGLQPKSGPAWALRGLCEFGLAEHRAARRSIDRALELGGLDDEALLRVVLYHQALLRIRSAEFESAIPPLVQLATGRPETKELAEACGLLLLRKPLLPADVPPSDRPFVEEAGRAYCSALARRAGEARSRYEALLASRPAERHLHYGYGLLLAQMGSPDAAAQFLRETELFPDHTLAHLELAFERVRRGKAKEAIAPARAAVRLAPDLFAAHLALGRALADSGDLPGGIVELETTARLSPGVPETFWALALAYGKAGRAADAAKARETFKRLDSARRPKDAPVPPPGTP